MSELGKFFRGLEFLVLVLSTLRRSVADRPLAPNSRADLYYVRRDCGRSRLLYQIGARQ